MAAAVTHSGFHTSVYRTRSMFSCIYRKILRQISFLRLEPGQAEHDHVSIHVIASMGFIDVQPFVVVECKQHLCKRTVRFTYAMQSKNISLMCLLFRGSQNVYLSNDAIAKNSTECIECWRLG